MLFCKMCLLHVDFHHRIFCELMLICMYLNPGGAGVSSHIPLAGGGGVYRPLSNFRTNRRSEEREAAIESSQRDDSNEILKFS